MIEVIPNWHPMLVHFTIALFISAWLFYLLAAVGASRDTLAGQWRITARWSLWLGALFTIATVLAGWDAYNSVAHDEASHRAMTEHRDWALVTAGLFFVLALWLGWRMRSGRREGPSFLVALTVAVVLLAATAWRGGELVYRHGLGVMSLPSSGEHDHAAHDHAHPGGEAAPMEVPDEASGETQAPMHDDGHDHDDHDHHDHEH